MISSENHIDFITFQARSSPRRKFMRGKPEPLVIATTAVIRREGQNTINEEIQIEKAFLQATL